MIVNVSFISSVAYIFGGIGERAEIRRFASCRCVISARGICSNSLVALGKRRRLGVYHVAMQEPMKNVRKIAGDQQ